MAAAAYFGGGLMLSNIFVAHHTQRTWSGLHGPWPIVGLVTVAAIGVFIDKVQTFCRFVALDAVGRRSLAGWPVRSVAVTAFGVRAFCLRFMAIDASGPLGDARSMNLVA